MLEPKIVFPKMLCAVLIFLSILFFIPNFVMMRIVQIGTIQQSLAILFFPLVYSIADAITEVYGKEKAHFVIFSCYSISLFFSIVLMLTCYLPFPIDFKYQDAYNLMLSKGPRVIIAGLISVGLSMFVNIKLMSKLKIKYRNRHFILRSFISSSVGELIVTGIGYPLSFMTFNKEILFLMINAYIFKIIYSFIGAYPAKYLVFLMRKDTLEYASSIPISNFKPTHYSY